MANIDFNRLEDWNSSRREKDVVICSFVTQRFGYLQTEMSRYEDSVKFMTPPQEPDLNMFSKSDRLEMKKKSLIALRMVYDTPAATKRFEQCSYEA